MKIEEILGFTTARGKSSETVTRRFYVIEETPEAAKSAFENYADELVVPDGMELGDVTLDEEKNANGLYFGTITFKLPEPKVKTKIAEDMFELYGEKMTEGRKSGSHERSFRIKSDSVQSAISRLENHIRSTLQTSGRLHISDISVDESQDGDGYYIGRVVYNNPDTLGSRDKLGGIVPAYGSRYTANKTSRNLVEDQSVD